MKRRSVLGLLVAVITGAAAPATAAASKRRDILIQESPLAGFQYHAGETLWAQLRVNAPLQLLREPDNEHDSAAVAVHFAGQRIGYLPRLENTAISQMLDRGERLTTRVVALQESRDPWQRMRLAVWLVT
jgi:hypothetical protein